MVKNSIPVCLVLYAIVCAVQCTPSFKQQPVASKEILVHETLFEEEPQTSIQGSIALSNAAQQDISTLATNLQIAIKAYWEEVRYRLETRLSRLDEIDIPSKNTGNKRRKHLITKKKATQIKNTLEAPLLALYDVANEEELVHQYNFNALAAARECSAGAPNFPQPVKMKHLLVLKYRIKAKIELQEKLTEQIPGFMWAAPDADNFLIWLWCWNHLMRYMQDGCDLGLFITESAMRKLLKFDNVVPPPPNSKAESDRVHLQPPFHIPANAFIQEELESHDYMDESPRFSWSNYQVATEHQHWLTNWLTEEKKQRMGHKFSLIYLQRFTFLAKERAIYDIFMQLIQAGQTAYGVTPDPAPPGLQLIARPSLLNTPSLAQSLAKLDYHTI